MLSLIHVLSISIGLYVRKIIFFHDKDNIKDFQPFPVFVVHTMYIYLDSETSHLCVFIVLLNFIKQLDLTPLLSCIMGLNMYIYICSVCCFITPEHLYTCMFEFCNFNGSTYCKLNKSQIKLTLNIMRS